MMNLGHWQIEGRQIEQDLKFDKARVRWKTQRLEIDLHFEDSHRPYPYAVGSSRIGDRVIASNSTGHRDHSWGARDWAVSRRYKWMHAQVGREVSMHFWIVEAMGRTELRGCVFKNQVMSLVADVDFTFDYTGKVDADCFSATVTDAEGRVTQLDATVVSRFQLYPNRGLRAERACGFRHHRRPPGRGLGRAVLARRLPQPHLRSGVVLMAIRREGASADGLRCGVVRVAT